MSGRWEGDYLCQRQYHPEADPFNAAVTRLKQHQAFSHVIFSAMVLKFNSKGKSTVRALVVTDRVVMKLDPAHGYSATVSSHVIPLANIVGLSLPRGAEPVVILHLSALPDIVLYFLSENLGAELMALLIQLLFREVLNGQVKNTHKGGRAGK